MINYLFGILTGLLTFYFYMIFRNYLNRRKIGRRSSEYKNSGVLTKLSDTLRHIVFTYDIKKNNSDFSLNVSIKNRLKFQVLHRSHFPEICKGESDISFGLALYLPISGISKDNHDKLINIFKEESEIFIYEESPFNYYVIDLGKRIRFASYLLTRIIKEVFIEWSEDNVTFELFSDGKLPYIGLPANANRS